MYFLLLIPLDQRIQAEEPTGKLSEPPCTLLSQRDSKQFILCEFRSLFSSEAWWTEVAKKIGFDIQIKLERLVFWRLRYHTAHERDLMELRASVLQPFHQEEIGLLIRHWHAAHLAANELSRWKLVETQDLTQNLAWLNCLFKKPHNHRQRFRREDFIGQPIDACACQGYYKQMKQQAVVKGTQQMQYRSEKKNLARLWAKEFAPMLTALSSSLLPCPQQGVWAVYSKGQSRTTSSGHLSVSAGQSKGALLLWLHSMKAVSFTE